MIYSCVGAIKIVRLTYQTPLLKVRIRSISVILFSMMRTATESKIRVKQALTVSLLCCINVMMVAIAEERLSKPPLPVMLEQDSQDFITLKYARIQVTIILYSEIFLMALNSLLQMKVLMTLLIQTLMKMGLRIVLR